MLRRNRIGGMSRSPRQPHLLAQVARVDPIVGQRLYGQRDAQPAAILALDDADLPLAGKADPRAEFRERQTHLQTEALDG